MTFNMTVLLQAGTGAETDLPTWLIAIISIVLVVIVIYISLKVSGPEKRKSPYQKRVTKEKEDKKDKELFLRD